MYMGNYEFDNFQPVDFLTIASQLNSEIFSFNSPSSSVNRTIFGRIYYGVFLTIREFLKNNTGYISNPFGEHRRLANYIESKGPFANSLNHKVAKYLRILKKNKVRNGCQYLMKY